jgi:hypothetical protein
MPVLDAKALDADPEGAALLRSVLDSGRKLCAVQDKKSRKQRQTKERTNSLDGQTASTAGSQQALAKVRE